MATSFKSYRKESRSDWGSSQEGALDLGQLKLGALLRIADGVETMARTITSLIDQNVRLKQQNDTLIRSQRSLRGINRRLKSALK